VVGFVGRLVREKGILELLEAGRRIRQRVPALRLLVVGPTDSDKSDALHPEVAREYGLEDICIFTGRRQDMADLYSMMDVLALPSYREGFPRTPMEASLMEVPSVVTDVRGCREAVEHGRNGLIVPARDATALAKAIEALLLDRDSAAALGKAGRILALERFDQQQIFSAVKLHYQRLLRGRSLPKDQTDSYPVTRETPDVKLAAASVEGRQSH
jgi:glycosyltransferase involved in cell wall biosynthesis